MDLSIIIPSFNTKELLKQCLDSIKKNSGNLSMEIIVVDNASADKTVAMVEDLARKGRLIKLIKNNRNLGFAKAVNQGIQEARGKYILLLNSDIIVNKKALNRLVEFADRTQDAGVIGGRLLDPEGSVQSSVYHFPSVVGAIREFWFGQKGTYQKYIPKTDGPTVVDTVTGAVMLIPRPTIRKIGLLGEKYFMYFEDLDYCRRIKDFGLKTYYLPEAEFVHHHGASGESIPEKTHLWQIESSKTYNGKVGHYILTVIIWLGQKWQKITKRN